MTEFSLTLKCSYSHSLLYYFIYIIFGFRIQKMVSIKHVFYHSSNYFIVVILLRNKGLCGILLRDKG